MDIEDYRKFYKKITGYYPYKFQERVFSELANGNGRIILQAPTGAGKTLAAVVPYLYFLENKISFPSKLVYSLPLRTLANSIKKDIDKLLVKNHLPYNLAIQTGEYTEDPKYLNDIIFTTIDQSLSSFLNIPVGLSFRMANLNAGAILSSFLVFDEIHLLEPEKSLFVMYELLRTTRMPFIIMTATLPRNFIDFLTEKLDAKYIYVQDREIKNINSQKDRKLSINIVDQQLNARDILSKHTNKTIIICNTVQKAQELYSEILKNKKANTEVLLIHSRFLGRYRKEKEDEIKKYFGKESSNNYSDKILIATQVIEAGIDISCDTMHTELAPSDSLLQRIGRCARYEGEKGKVFIHIPKTATPYNKSLCSATYKTLKHYSEITTSDNQTIQDMVLSDYYQEIQTQIINNDTITNMSNGLGLINETMDTSEKGNYQRLIRKIDSMNIIIHSNPDSIENPYEYEAISVSPNQLSKYLSKLSSVGFEDRWIIKKCAFDPDKNRYNYIDLVLEGLDFQSIRNELTKELILIINPNYAYHDNNIGFYLKNNNKTQENFQKIIDEKPERIDYSYEKETWLDHALNVYKASKKVKIASYPTSNLKIKEYKFIDEIKYAICKYSDILHVQEDILIHALDLTLLLHDYGKLRKDWQEIAKNWMIREKNYDSDEINNELWAHTAFNPELDNHKPNRPRFPSHAGIGAVAISPLLFNYFNKHIKNSETSEYLTRIVVSAIARHHSPTIYNINKNRLQNTFQIEKNAIKKVKTILEIIGLNVDLKPLEETLIFNDPTLDLQNDYLINRKTINSPILRDIYSLYQIFVRILRLSDGYSLI